jgi:hypothetical protein
VLDGTRAGFGPIDCHIARRALRGSAGAFSASSGSVDRDPLTPLVQQPAWNTASRIRSSRLIPVCRGHVNGGGVAWIKVPSIAGDCSERSCESPSLCVAPAGRPVHLPRVFIDVQDID